MPFICIIAYFLFKHLGKQPNLGKTLIWENFPKFWEIFLNLGTLTFFFKTGWERRKMGSEFFSDLKGGTRASPV